MANCSLKIVKLLSKKVDVGSRLVQKGGYRKIVHLYSEQRLKWSEMNFGHLHLQKAPQGAI